MTPPFAVLTRARDRFPSMRRALVVVIALLAVVGGTSAPAHAGGFGNHKKFLIERHNQKRAQYGHGPLTRSKWANAMAQSTARRIAGESAGGCTLRHTDPNALLGWYNAAVAENLGCVWGCVDSRTAFKQFWHSPPHQANMLGGYRWIGVGIECWGAMSYFAVHYVS